MKFDDFSVLEIQRELWRPKSLRDLRETGIRSRKNDGIEQPIVFTLLYTDVRRLLPVDQHDFSVKRVNETSHIQSRCLSFCSSLY